ncbi:uncharacterized protein NFIA_045730 [Aspergillus fischeri NRRL 181]|uniref:Cytochrome P450 n=1 Tax=Neosartorya fischeri (strain ATCC 1020 / DSM 3700 / CBS 544.65 / FGSC A1164 / JCM 1740 / NRRL 181 / WB 181) TaxID=331117 RepID=A1CVH6_NEOFI|nr:uncharacterized protein NFIA_045730 [Aspergillus fischeri NRRL 181]EAW25753.1 hypothetical protein NFIA_045730 [Aspergillus fischeri NRRL 181]
MFTAPLSIAILSITLLYWVVRVYLNYLRYERTAAQFGCPPLKHYPGWDRILGLDYVYAMFKALKEDRFLEFQTETYSARGSKVWTANFMGNRMVYSSEPENMKAMSTLQRDCFAVEPIRVANGAITPFTGRGVSSSDERDWPHRDMVTVMRGLRLRLQLSSFLFLHRDKEWFATCKRIHGFLDGYIDKAYKHLEYEKSGKPATYANGEP